MAGSRAYSNSGAIMTASKPVAAFLDELYSGFSLIRGPLFVAGVAFLLFSTPEQIIELYRVLAQDLATPSLSYETTVDQSAWSRFEPRARIIAAIAGLIFLSSVLWYLAARITQASLSEAGGDSLLRRRVARCGQQLIVILPFYGAIMGLHTAYSEQVRPMPPIDSIDSLYELEMIERIYSIMPLAANHLQKAIALLFFLAIVMWIGLGLLGARLLSVGDEPVGRSAFGRCSVVTFICSVAILFIARELSPVALPQMVGTIPLVALFLVVVAIAIAVLTEVYRRYRIPILTLLLVAAFLFSFYDWNDNHEIAMLNGRSQAANDDARKAGEKTLESQFKLWLNARKDRDYYAKAGKPYYVYIVAAEGGGLYAAYRTANFLTKMQDICPAFAQHIFAAVGVSGGSLGLATFSSLIKEFGSEAATHAIRLQGPCAGKNDRESGQLASFERRADLFLSSDFIAPLAAALMFPDAIQRFLPVAINRFDRARALEQSFIKAWDQVLRKEMREVNRRNLFADSFYESWQPEGLAPALLLTATDVQYGRRVVIRPFSHESTEGDTPGVRRLQAALGFDEIASYLELCDTQPSLATAVTISARAPVITPVATLIRRGGCLKDEDLSKRQQADNTNVIAKGLITRRPKVERWRLADGGYYENTGVETAYQLMRNLQSIAAEHEELKDKNIKFRLLVLSVTGEYFRDARDINRAGEGLNEIWAPIRTLLRTRQARGHAALLAALTEAEIGNVLLLPLDTNFFALPLGWQLSTVSRNYIKVHFDSSGKCPNELDSALGGRYTIDSINDVMQKNACGYRIIRRDLMGD